MVIEAGLVTGYVIAWAVSKGRRAAGRVDAEVDAVLDAGLDRLHATVASRLGEHPALDDLADEATSPEGQVSELTRQQLELAITAAVRRDDEFGRHLTEDLIRVQAVEKEAGRSVVAGPASTVFSGDAHPQASGHGIAFGQVGGNAIVNRDSEGNSKPDPF